MDLFSGLSFGAPWILGGAGRAAGDLVAAARHAAGAEARGVSAAAVAARPASAEETPARTPLVAACCCACSRRRSIIVALAGPQHRRTARAAGNGPLVLFVDNGWTAAHALGGARGRDAPTRWRGAARDDRAVAIVPTAERTRAQITLLDAGKAARMRRANSAPQPWLPDRAQALAALTKARIPTAPQILWLSDGLEHGDAARRPPTRWRRSAR